MAIEISEKIRFYGKEAIEDRLNVATIEDRNNIPLNERYNGMITTVRSEGKRYELLFDGDFEGLNETEKDAFLGNNDNWKEETVDVYTLSNKDKAKDIGLLEIDDWDDVVDTGLYMGSNKANAPADSDVSHTWRYVQVMKHNDDYCVQIAWDFAGVAIWIRTKVDGYWRNWKRVVVQGDSVTITTEGWGKGKNMTFKAIVDDDIGIQEWVMGRIYATPHNDGYYQGEVSPMFYVGKIHRFLKDDTEGSEEKGDIEAGKLTVDAIEEGNSLEMRSNKPIKLIFKDPRHPDSSFLGPGQQILVGNLIAGNGSNFSEYGYNESGFPTKSPSPLRHPIVGGGVNGTIYAENGMAAPAMEAMQFNVSTRDGGSTEVVFRDEDENHSWPTAYIEADPSTIDSNGRRSFKYTANKHIFQKEGVSEPEPGEIETGTITASGNITAFSDKRLKANIKPIANALEKIERIQGVSYTRKDQADKKRQHIGVIAQDLLEVVPEVVNVPVKAEEMHSVDYSKLTALLIEGMKEQQKEIELLKQEIKSLKGGK